MKRLIALSLMLSFSLSPAAAAAAAARPGFDFPASIFENQTTAASALRQCLEGVYHRHSTTPTELPKVLLAAAEAFKAAAEENKMTLSILQLAATLCETPHFLMLPVEEQEQRIAKTLSLLSDMRRSKSSKYTDDLSGLGATFAALAVDTKPLPATAAERFGALSDRSPYATGSTDGDDAMHVNDGASGDADGDDAGNEF